MAVAEMYYTAHEVHLLVKLHVKTVLKLMKEGELGTLVNLGSEIRPDYRVSAHGFNEFIARHVVLEPGVSARSVGELRRKVNKQHAAPSFGQSTIPSTHNE